MPPTDSPTKAKAMLLTCAGDELERQWESQRSLWKNKQPKKRRASSGSRHPA
ncbi:hypothetical protein HPP92_016172 [Vanilla planifolia]|uniref:Uncharacterized protein n=1 Tax=Vanilla planifolia TaxID=51239 RepID=A0A835QJZ1_VANPL|nr:hypothetical protein HPP92_016773 [Vanilla planifolia]KAG0471626.1 hypothetical protein HPP92_016172 [Vanilla planifolia]